MTRLQGQDVVSNDYQVRSILKIITGVISAGTTTGLVYVFTGETNLAVGGCAGGGVEADLLLPARA